MTGEENPKSLRGRERMRTGQNLMMAWNRNVERWCNVDEIMISTLNVLLSHCHCHWSLLTWATWGHDVISWSLTGFSFVFHIVGVVYQEKTRHININLLGRWALWWPGGLLTGRPGSKTYVLSSEPKVLRNIFFSRYPTGRTCDRGDRTKCYVLKFYVLFLLPTLESLNSLGSRTPRNWTLWKGPFFKRPFSKPDKANTTTKGTRGRASEKGIHAITLEVFSEQLWE